MVVKASTKPWPRQLGSSIIRALPPLGQARQAKSGLVRSPGVQSIRSQIIGDNPKYLLAMPPMHEVGGCEHAGQFAARPPPTAARRRRHREQLEPRSRPPTTCSSSLPRRRARRCSSKSTEEERPCASNFLCASPPPLAAPRASHPLRSCWPQPAHLGLRRLWLEFCCRLTKDDSGAELELCAWHVPRSTVHVCEARVRQDGRVVLERARRVAAPCERRRALRDRVVRAMYSVHHTLNYNYEGR